MEEEERCEHYYGQDGAAEANVCHLVSSTNYSTTINAFTSRTRIVIMPDPWALTMTYTSTCNKRSVPQHQNPVRRTLPTTSRTYCLSRPFHHVHLHAHFQRKMQAAGHVSEQLRRNTLPNTVATFVHRFNMIIRINCKRRKTRLTAARRLRSNTQSHLQKRQSSNDEDTHHALISLIGYTSTPKTPTTNTFSTLLFPAAAR